MTQPAGTTGAATVGDEGFGGLVALGNGALCLTGDDTASIKLSVLSDTWIFTGSVFFHCALGTTSFQVPTKYNLCTMRPPTFEGLPVG